eukprot:CAMPEP_0113898958 /NCGR_PEP_ID=MMETSP0780_2-20120614/19719_1 /TAXON_ID=652834 /ORGANISM="Palpitomonas bilix" /LENGTH=250 /DNA_ID=CAMNT_0000890981 /DNA_START=180 /DNA_END=932 /DNA_ORIENTATION=+ /assembly_acc=CAM_ASM_000599
MAEKEKEKGNEAFKKGDYARALTHFNEAIFLHPTSSVLYTNRAAVYLKKCKYEAAIDDCDRALSFSPSSVKAMYRKALALRELGEWKEAAEVVEGALKVVGTHQQLEDLRDELQGKASSSAEVAEGVSVVEVKVKYLRQLFRVDFDTDQYEPSFTALAKVIGAKPSMLKLVLNGKKMTEANAADLIDTATAKGLTFTAIGESSPDEHGCADEDIAKVMAALSVSREYAVKALRNNSFDVVDAIRNSAANR